MKKPTCFTMIPGKTYFEFSCGCIADKFHDAGHGRKCKKHKTAKVINRMFICIQCGIFCVRVGNGPIVDMCTKHSKDRSRKKCANEDAVIIKPKKVNIKFDVKRPCCARSEACAFLNGINHIPVTGLIKTHRDMFK